MSFQIKSVSSGASEPALRFPVALDATKKYFVDKFNSPCFGLAEDAAELNTKLSAADVDVYLINTKLKGINLIWVQGLENTSDGFSPNNFNGDAPFTGGVDFVNPNNSYWNFMDYVMGRCLQLGITVAFNPMFYSLDDTTGYKVSIKGSSDSVLQAFAAYLVARYKKWPNLIWLMGGDQDPNDATGMAKIDVFASAIRALDPTHLITHEQSRFLGAGGSGGAAPNGGYSSVDGHVIAFGSKRSWLDINWVYQTQSTHLSGAQRCYSQGLPCLLGEGWYELEHSMTALLLRNQAYQSVFGGCTLGHMFGNGAIWSFNYDGTETSFPWKGQLDSTGRTEFQKFGLLMNSRSHHLLVPDLTNVTMTVGSSSSSACARTSDGLSALFYLPTQQTITADMTKITDGGGQANCNWFNPRTGAVTAIGNISTTGTHDFTSPDSNDWVLAADSAAANLRTLGT